MKAEEAQICDLVLCYNPYRVVDEYGIITTIEPREGNTYPSTFSVWIPTLNGTIGHARQSQVKPILITHDILAKNGWELKNGVMVFKNDVIRIGLKEDGTLIFGYYEWPIKVTAVHQLQHILRDVGLVEYANSMRI